MKKKILVVDDEVEMVTLLAEFLGKSGFEVITANDGGEALEHVHQSLPDIILMDIMLPKIDGWAVCQKLKSDEKFRKIPIILFSGILGADSEADPAIEKCDYMVAKPFEMQNLLLKINQLISR